uniref:Uncharacterized protein MANES_18G078600 n=1 Tax=Rhizophora mucronata TaxID=61149 RepID=A0A2P2LS71_RHIMU
MVDCPSHMTSLQFLKEMSKCTEPSNSKKFTQILKVRVMRLVRKVHPNSYIVNKSTKMYQTVNSTNHFSQS